MSFTSGSIDSIEQGTEIGLSQSFPNIDTNIDFESRPTKNITQLMSERYKRQKERKMKDLKQMLKSKPYYGRNT